MKKVLRGENPAKEGGRQKENKIPVLLVRAIYTLQENYSEFDAMALPG